MASDKLTTTQVLLPVLLLSTTLIGFFAFQTSLMVADRASLHQTYVQQETTLDQITKLKAQINALAMGTFKLSQEGDKDAVNIVTQLKKAGINIDDHPTPNTNASQMLAPTTGKAPAP